MSSAIRKKFERRKSSSTQPTTHNDRIVMSGSEPSTPKAKGPAPAVPQGLKPATEVAAAGGAGAGVNALRNGQSLAEARTHGRSVSAGAYSLNRLSSTSTGKEKKRHSKMSRQDASESSCTLSFDRSSSLYTQSTMEDDSDADSQDSDQSNSQDSKSSPAKPTSGKSGDRKQEWEIIEGLKDGQSCTEKPDKYEGYMMKRRKWPLKGWHKRYFVLENGILTYAKSPSDILKGKYHGTVDIGLSFLTYKAKHRRIDIDAEDLIYHIKVGRVKSQHLLFDEWINRLRHHRLYRQNEISYGSKDVPKLTDVPTPDDFSTPVTSPVSPVPFGETISSRGSIKMRSMDRSQSKVMAWLLDAQGMEQCNKDLATTQAKIFELSGLLEKLNAVPLYNTYSAENVLELHDLATSKKLTKKEKKQRTKLGKADQRSSDRLNGLSPRSTASKEPTPSPALVQIQRPPRYSKQFSLEERGFTALKSVVPNMERPLHPSSSNPNLFTQNSTEATRPLSLHDNTGHDAHIQDMKLRDDFVTIAKSVHDTLRGLTRTMTTERERFKRALEAEQVPGSSTATIHSLKSTLHEVMKQNEDYRQRLGRIHADSNMSGSAMPAYSSSRGPTPTPTPVAPHEKLLEKVHSTAEHPLIAASGSWESQSAQEFYDATEYLVSTDSSEGSEEEDEVSSEISDTENNAVNAAEETAKMKQLNTGRRSNLPVPKPDTDISLWSLLCKNIGKDLSKISMPVTLNEPISMLQRLCEELEYTELVDKAADIDDPLERMVYIAAFTVSPYASTYYRAGQKPFNPLLGETYECLREDKGWRFIAEQTSHHPPVSACYCESKNFIFWQDVQIKTKFWGKSMEIQPKGTVNLKLPKYKDHYTWNKATTCVHNLLGGQRWVDHYGEVVIRNHSHGIKCKLTYAKSTYWSDKRHEVYGTITNSDGKVLHHLFGKWNEGIYYGHAPSAKCVWRPGSMPEEFDLYYGFSRFAIELNDLVADQIHLYAPTDTRFRPDQRLLEEGKLTEAENEKVRLENTQRERRKQREEEKTVYSSRWFMKVEEGGQESFMYTGKYWELRKDPGFNTITFPKLW